MQSSSPLKEFSIYSFLYCPLTVTCFSIPLGFERKSKLGVCVLVAPFLSSPSTNIFLLDCIYYHIPLLVAGQIISCFVFLLLNLLQFLIQLNGVTLFTLCHFKSIIQP